MDKPLLGGQKITYLTMTASGKDSGIITGIPFTSWLCRIHPGLNIITSTVCVILAYYVLDHFLVLSENEELKSVVIMVLSSWACGKIAGMMSLPPLLGMLLAGIALRNLDKFNTNESINIFQPHIKKLREVAVTVLLIASGLSLDASMLKKLSMVVMQLAILPCITETIATAVVTHYFLNMDWVFGILLGCVLSPVSSAVILPALLDYKQKGLGEDKGIITLVMAACSFDDIFAISAFGVCLSIIFSEGDWTTSAMQGPIEVSLGLGAGVICGALIGLIPHKCEVNLTVKRTYILTAAGVLMTFVSSEMHYAGIGPLAIMTASFVAAIFWKKNDSFSEDVEIKANDVWDFMEPLLFASIGTEIDLNDIKGPLLVWSFGLLTVTTLVRVLTCFFVLRNTEFNLREKIFVNIAWLPKATVQAAIGPIALDQARNNRSNDDIVKQASQVLAISVLAILITAPLGAILMKLRGEYLLKKVR